MSDTGAARDYAPTFSSLSLEARAAWSKSEAGEGAGHTLLAHMLDVAAVVEVMLDREPEATLDWAADRLGLPRNSCRRWVATIAGLHDFGKAIPGFNAKWEAGCARARAAGLSFPPRACRLGNHSQATAGLLAEVLQEKSQAPSGWTRGAVQAIAAHHGRHFSASERRNGKPRGEPPEWARARKELLDFYWRTLAPRGNPVRETLDMVGLNWLAGITSAADWIASNTDWFPLGVRRDDIGAYYEHAKQLADRGLKQAGWRAAKSLLREEAETGELLSRIRDQETEARPLQMAGDNLLQSASGPSLMLVEAPMGEGKTELAYLAHLRLQSRNGHRGLYVALPTQATGNALFKRTREFLGAFVQEHTDIQLVHGGAPMNDQVRHLRGIADDPEESISASAWFSQRRRPLLSAYGVGTVDQALLGTLNVKHHFVRLWGLANRVVVLDEVHAYDTYTGVLIEGLVRWLKAMGSSVVLMSATLPKNKRDSLVRAWGGEPEALPELSYPRLTLIDDNGPRGASVPSRPLASIALYGLDESLETIRDQAIALLQEGGCGAVIVNTVDRAQTLFGLLAAAAVEQGVNLVLFHARFPADVRAERERQVLGLFGPPRRDDSRWHRPAKGLLIATQVAEQSLDLDFDFMISDLAPIDLLLQRAGRMHRHVRSRPVAHAEARLWVAGLHADRLPSLKDTAWEYVYDPFILGHTWACLRGESRIELPADIDRLVQHVYGDPELPADIHQKIREFIDIESYGAHLGTEQAKQQQAIDVSLDIEAEPARAYQDKLFGGDDEEGMRNVTRLGPDSVGLVPIAVVGGQWTVKGVPLDPERRLDDDMARALYERQLRVSRKAVVVSCQQSELPPAFAEHPLLKHLYPMPMVDSRCEMGGQAMRLDDTLGLVYEEREK